MTFETYMHATFPSFDLGDSEMRVSGAWLRKFWLAAQKSMLGSAVEGVRAANPCPLVILSKEEAVELMNDSVRVWLDDVRPMPKEGFDIHVKTAEEAIALIESGTVSFMSFDHDLGFDIKTMMCDPKSKTGYDVAKLVERLAFEGKLARFGWAVHSMNPDGAHKIEMALNAADRFWSNKERTAG